MVKEWVVRKGDATEGWGGFNSGVWGRLWEAAGGVMRDQHDPEETGDMFAEKRERKREGERKKETHPHPSTFAND